jgi:hypothetical protein
MRQATIKLALFFASILFIMPLATAQIDDLAIATTARNVAFLNTFVTDSLPKAVIKATVSAELHEFADVVKYDDYSSSSVLYGLLATLLIGVILNVFVVIQDKFMYN